MGRGASAFPEPSTESCFATDSSHVRLQTLRDTTIREYGVLLLTIPVVLTVRIALWLLPSNAMLRFAGRLPAPAHATSNFQPEARTIIWAVDAVARRIPRASCLTQALSGKLLLAWFGHRSQLCLGVAYAADGSLRAHAWLEHDGHPILGGAGIHSMARLPELPDPTRLAGPRR